MLDMADQTQKVLGFQIATTLPDTEDGETQGKEIQSIKSDATSMEAEIDV